MPKVKAAPFAAEFDVKAFEQEKEIIVGFSLAREELFAGHFPGNPIFPGVYQLELVNQAAALMIGGDPRSVQLRSIHSIRYNEPLRPEDHVICHCKTGNTAETEEGELFEVSAVCTSGNKKVATFHLTFLRRWQDAAELRSSEAIGLASAPHLVG